MDERVDLSTVLRATRSRPGLATIVMVVAVGLGVLATSLMPKTYASTSSVLVGATTADTDLAREDILASQSLAATYADLARRQPVLETVVKELGLKMSWRELRDRVQANVAPSNLQLILITAQGNDEQQAYQVTRAVTDRLVKMAPRPREDPATAFVTGQLQRLQTELTAREAELAVIQTRRAVTQSGANAEALQSRASQLTRQISELRSGYKELRELLPRNSAPNTLRVLEPAAVNPVPVRPKPQMNMLAAVLLGALVALVVCYWAEARGVRYGLLPSSRSCRPGRPDMRY